MRGWRRACWVVWVLVAGSARASVGEEGVCPDGRPIEVAVHVASCRLTVACDGKEVGAFTVATAKPGAERVVPWEKSGWVDRVRFNPVWFPTQATREAYRKTKGVELPERVAPGDPANAMGKVAIELAFEGVAEPLRIHATNQPATIGKRSSRGCVRMHHGDIAALVDLIVGEGLRRDVFSGLSRQAARKVRGEDLRRVRSTFAVEVPRDLVKVRFVRD